MNTKRLAGERDTYGPARQPPHVLEPGMAHAECQSGNSRAILRHPDRYAQSLARGADRPETASWDFYLTRNAVPVLRPQTSIIRAEAAASAEYIAS